MIDRKKLVVLATVAVMTASSTANVTRAEDFEQEVQD